MAGLVWRSVPHKDVRVKFDFLTNPCTFNKRSISEKKKLGCYTRTLSQWYWKIICQHSSSFSLSSIFFFFKSDKNKCSPHKLCKTMNTNDLMKIYNQTLQTTFAYVFMDIFNKSVQQSTRLQRWKEYKIIPPFD